MRWTDEDEAKHQAATMCHVCNESFSAEKGKGKVRDHDHKTGVPIGSAHMSCNVKLCVKKSVSVYA